MGEAADEESESESQITFVHGQELYHEQDFHHHLTTHMPPHLVPYVTFIIWNEVGDEIGEHLSLQWQYLLYKTWWTFCFLCHRHQFPCVVHCIDQVHSTKLEPPKQSEGSTSNCPHM